jgi:hypothetical protein
MLPEGRWQPSVGRSILFKIHKHDAMVPAKNDVVEA